MVTRLHQPHAIVVRLHVRKINFVILIPETSRRLSLSVGFSTQDEAMDVVRSVPQGAHYHTDVTTVVLIIVRMSRLVTANRTALTMLTQFEEPNSLSYD